MADAINLTVSNGDGPSVVVEASNTINTVVATAESSTSISISTGSVPSVTLATSPSSGITVSQNNSVVSTVSQLSNSVTVSTGVQSPMQWNLEDLVNVSGTPSSQQVLVYDSSSNSFVFADQFSVVAGSQNINAGINVTNTDSAFDTILNQTYEAGTSVTTILSQILNPYVEATLTLNNIKFVAEGVGVAQSSGVDVSVEVGSNVIFNGVDFATTAASQILEGSIKLLRDGATMPTLEGFAEEGFNGNFSDLGMSNQTLEYNGLETDTFRVSAVDSGNTSVGATYSITSNSISVSWKYRVVLSTSNINLNAGEDSNFNSIMSGATEYGNIDDTEFVSTGAFDLTTGAASDGAGQYTYISYPKALGYIDSIVNQNFPVLGDFTFVGEFNRTNSWGLTQIHYIYKSNQTQAFSAGDKLEITTS